MKDAFENNMKQSLENFEMPYDSAAWTAMQSRLDASAPTPSFEEKMKEGLNANEYPYNPAAWTAMNKRLDKNAKGGSKKWYYAAGILGAAAITTAVILSLNSEDSSKEQTTPTQKVQTASNTNTSKSDVSNNGTQKLNKVSGTANSNNQTTSNNSESGNVASLIDGQNASNTNSTNNTASSSTQNDGNRETNANSGLNNGSTTTNTPNNPIRGQQNNTSNWKYIAPAIPEMVCEGTSIQIENENDFPLVIIYPNGLNWVGNDHQVTRLNPSLAGVYKIGYLRNQEFVEKSQFVVNESPVAEFGFVDLSQKYLNGLPTIEVRATSQAASYVWEYKNGTEYGEQVGLHFYEKGVHPFKLTVTNENGCSSTIEKTVNVDEKYNLMAMTGFRPNSSLQENITFMPYALQERDANFTMLILDPNDGHVMYETSDASKGWDGIDQSTGTMAPVGNQYIWKVTIMNPQKGEPSAYTGTISLID